MKKFEITIDQKIVGWERNTFIVEAEDENKAIEEATRRNDEIDFGYMDSSEKLFETDHLLQPYENYALANARPDTPEELLEHAGTFEIHRIEEI